MSVIMAYKTENKIYLGADKRVTNIKDGSYSDKNTKLIIINKRLAMVCSGSKYVQSKFENFIKGKKVKKWTTDDVKMYLEILCNSLNLENNIDVINEGAYFIVGGLDGKKKMNLWSASWNHGKYSGNNVELAIYPPKDVDMQTCCNIYIPNVHEHFSVFIQKTIKEISEKSKIVSPSGDIWIYDMKSGKSTSEHFD